MAIVTNTNTPTGRKVLALSKKGLSVKEIAKRVEKVRYRNLHRIDVAFVIGHLVNTKLSLDLAVLTRKEYERASRIAEAIWGDVRVHPPIMDLLREQKPSGHIATAAVERNNIDVGEGAQQPTEVQWRVVLDRAAQHGKRRILRVNNERAEIFVLGKDRQR